MRSVEAGWGMGMMGGGGAMIVMWKLIGGEGWVAKTLGFGNANGT